MALRIVAYVLNAGLIGLGLLALLQGGVCATIVLFAAGGFNLAALIKGQADDDAMKNVGLFCNGVALIYGLFAAYQTWQWFSGAMLADLELQQGSEAAVAAANTIGGSISLAITICLLGAGAVTMTVFIREDLA